MAYCRKPIIMNKLNDPNPKIANAIIRAQLEFITICRYINNLANVSINVCNRLRYRCDRECRQINIIVY